MGSGTHFGAITDGIAGYGINGPRSTRYVNVTCALKRFALQGLAVKHGKSWALPAVVIQQSAAPVSSRGDATRPESEVSDGHLGEPSVTT